MWSASVFFSSPTMYPLPMRQPVGLTPADSSSTTLRSSFPVSVEATSQGTPDCQLWPIVLQQTSLPSRARVVPSAMRPGWQLVGEDLPNVYLFWGLCLRPKDNGCCFYLYSLQFFIVNPFLLLNNTPYYIFYSNYYVVLVSSLNTKTTGIQIFCLPIYCVYIV